MFKITEKKIYQPSNNDIDFIKKQCSSDVHEDTIKNLLIEYEGDYILVLEKIWNVIKTVKKVDEVQEYFNKIRSIADERDELMNEHFKTRTQDSVSGEYISGTSQLNIIQE